MSHCHICKYMYIKAILMPVCLYMHEKLCSLYYEPPFEKEKEEEKGRVGGMEAGRRRGSVHMKYTPMLYALKMPNLSLSLT